jgi:hypothetical protein
MSIKEDFHHLIDTIEDEQVLNGFYQLIRLNTGEYGQLWNNLKEEQKNELHIAYDESFDPRNLISHEEVKKQHERWLKP